jgi:hypothetical protein
MVCLYPRLPAVLPYLLLLGCLVWLLYNYNPIMLSEDCSYLHWLSRELFKR